MRGIELNRKVYAVINLILKFDLQIDGRERLATKDHPFVSLFFNKFDSNIRVFPSSTKLAMLH